MFRDVWKRGQSRHRHTRSGDHVPKRPRLTNEELQWQTPQRQRTLTHPQVADTLVSYDEEQYHRSPSPWGPSPPSQLHSVRYEDNHLQSPTTGQKQSSSGRSHAYYDDHQYDRYEHRTPPPLMTLQLHQPPEMSGSYQGTTSPIVSEDDFQEDAMPEEDSPLRYENLQYSYDEKSQQQNTQADDEDAALYGSEAPLESKVQDLPVKTNQAFVFRAQALRCTVCNVFTSSPQEMDKHEQEAGHIEKAKRVIAQLKVGAILKAEIKRQEEKKQSEEEEQKRLQKAEEERLQLEQEKRRQEEEERQRQEDEERRRQEEVKQWTEEEYSQLKKELIQQKKANKKLREDFISLKQKVEKPRGEIQPKQMPSIPPFKPPSFKLEDNAKYCEICKFTVTNQEYWQAHIKSPRHQTSVTAKLRKVKVNTEQLYPFYCTVCCSVATAENNFMEHLKGKAHKAKTNTLKGNIKTEPKKVIVPKVSAVDEPKQEATFKSKDSATKVVIKRKLKRPKQPSDSPADQTKTQQIIPISAPSSEPHIRQRESKEPGRNEPTEDFYSLEIHPDTPEFEQYLDVPANRQTSGGGQDSRRMVHQTQPAQTSRQVWSYHETVEVPRYQPSTRGTVRLTNYQQQPSTFNYRSQGKFNY